MATIDLNTPEQHDRGEDDKPASGYPTEETRQRTILLKRPWQQITLIVALTAAVLLAIALPFLWPR
jgi:hypothetical protein